MSKYGQYCPIAQALEIVGERWTLLIIRDMLLGATHFNDLERGLPGISRGLLAARLRQLQDAGIIEKQVNDTGRQTTAYHLTPAGKALKPVIDALLVWGAEWAFGDPSEEELDPVLLMWWMRNRIRSDALPENRVVVQFEFHGAKNGTFWLLLTRADVSVCLTNPGYEIDVLVNADLAAFYKLWLGRITYREALESGVHIEGVPRLTRAFPRWFAWSAAADTVRAAVAKQRSAQVYAHP